MWLRLIVYRLLYFLNVFEYERIRLVSMTCDCLKWCQLLKLKYGLCTINNCAHVMLKLVIVYAKKPRNWVSLLAIISINIDLELANGS